MFPVGPTSCVPSNCLEHKIWGYKPIYLERGRKLAVHPEYIVSFTRYKPIYLERGRKPTGAGANAFGVSDINLSTSRGDGNFDSASSHILSNSI